MIKANISTEKSRDVVWCKRNVTALVFLPTLTAHYSHEENIRQIPICLQNNWPILLKTTQVDKHKRSLRNCHRQGEPKENDNWM